MPHSSETWDFNKSTRSTNQSSDLSSSISIKSFNTVILLFVKRIASVIETHAHNIALIAVAVKMIDQFFLQYFNVQ